MPKSLQTYIHGTLSDELPPANPILRAGWGGLAFDRNRYEELAPIDIWNAFLEIHCGPPREGCELLAISFDRLAAGGPAESVSATMPTLCTYWNEHARFLKDHYILSPTRDWIVRLDQDVTLFVGERIFLNRIVSTLGGLEAVMEKMVDDMDPGPVDSVGLRRYLDSITRPLR